MNGFMIDKMVGSCMKQLPTIYIFIIQVLVLLTSCEIQSPTVMSPDEVLILIS